MIQKIGVLALVVSICICEMSQAIPAKRVMVIAMGEKTFFSSLYLSLSYEKSNESSNLV